jgi:RNA recognition motif-containing protein
VEHFHNKAVDNLICNARPFQDKGESTDRIDADLLSKRVYLMNIPYDTHLHELEMLCKEFAEVDKIVIPRDPKGLARGYAFVYVKNIKDVQTLIDYVDGRHIR